jgi:sulfur-oxidizing protein SoxY
VKRREVLAVTLLGAALPAMASPAINAFTGGAAPRNGRVAIDIAALVENGHMVPVSVQVESAMTAAEHVKRIALFTERNPLPEVAVFTLGPHNATARVATRMRLATSQRITALAEMSDGSYWQQTAEVVVTLAACIEGT